MANVSEKFGLRPYRKLDGTPLVGAQNRYIIKSGYATAIYQGDLVKPTSTGHIERHTANTSAAVVGVFNGVFYNDPTTQKPTFKNYYPGGVTPTQGSITAFIVDDPDAVFLMDADAAFSRADLYKNYSVTNKTGVTQKVYQKCSLMLELQVLRARSLFKQWTSLKSLQILKKVQLALMYLLESTIISTVKVELG